MARCAGHRRRMDSEYAVDVSSIVYDCIVRFWTPAGRESSLAAQSSDAPVLQDVAVEI